VAGRVRRHTVVAALAVALGAACSDGGPSENGLAVARREERNWHEHGYLTPGDEFSAEERECIAGNSDDLDVDLDDLGAPSYGTATDALKEFVSRNADECFTDEHLEHLFVVDMEAQLFLPSHARCMAPGVLALVREHGHRTVFDERPDEIADRFVDLRAQCGID
jgi:hypothetical protein